MLSFHYDHKTVLTLKDAVDAMAIQGDRFFPLLDGLIKIQQFYTQTFRVVSFGLPMFSMIYSLDSNRMVTVQHRKLKKINKFVNIERLFTLGLILCCTYFKRA